MDMLRQQKPPLMARQYRQLWLEDANTLGLIGECLAEALGWQPSDDQPLPDPLELAQAAAERIVQLEAQQVFVTIMGAQHRNIRHLTITTG